MNIDEIIRHRRSHFVNELNGEEVPNEIVERMLENARWAPSHKLTFPWRLKRFSKEEKDKLCLEFENYYIQETPSEKFNQKKLDKIRTYKDKISDIISVGMKPSGQVPEWEELAATAMAVQNMFLTLTPETKAAGYWSTGNGAGSEYMRIYTDLEEGSKQLGFFLLGMTDNKRYEAVREFEAPLQIENLAQSPG